MHRHNALSFFVTVESRANLQMYEAFGKQYSSLKALSEAFDLPSSTILSRLDQGLPLEDALSKPRHSFIPVDVQGIKFSSIAAAARHFGLNATLVRSRLSNQWTIDEAFNLIPRKKKITNHNNKGKPVCVKGVHYPSIKEAAIAHGFKARFISNRINRGLTIEQALEVVPFPDWFVPGAGQGIVQKAKNKAESRRSQALGDGGQICCGCNLFQPLSSFHGSIEKNTLSSRCRDCISANFLRYRYNISFNDFMELRKSQNDQCKICKSQLEISKNSSFRSKKVAIDHCHRTGEVRGLLCSRCNTGLGHFGDNIELMQAAIHYLQEFSTRNGGAL